MGCWGNLEPGYSRYPMPSGVTLTKHVLAGFGGMARLALASQRPGKVQPSHGNCEELNVLEDGTALSPLHGGRSNKVKS